MCVVSAHQPPYFPWFGLLDKIAHSDVFVILDTVQYTRRGFENRTLYSTADGARYLTLPVRARGHQTAGLAIQDVLLEDGTAPQRHLETLRHRYHGRPGWPALEPRLAETLEAPAEHLLDLSLRTLRLTLAVFGLVPEIRFASDLDCTGSKTELMCQLTEAAGGDVYLSGSGARAYMDDAVFTGRGLTVQYQEFVHPCYPQSHPGAFQPGCLALEWFLEDPVGALSGFHDHMRRSSSLPLRCC